MLETDMETKDQRRHRKLVLLSTAKGDPAALAAQSGTNPAYLKQVMKGTLLPAKKDGTRSPRALGDAAAEALEDAYLLGRGWFDSNEPIPDKPPQAQQTATRYSPTGWPFLHVTKDEYENTLTREERDEIEKHALGLLALRRQTSQPYSLPPSTGGPEVATGGRAFSKPSEYQKAHSLRPTQQAPRKHS